MTHFDMTIKHFTFSLCLRSGRLQSFNLKTGALRNFFEDSGEFLILNPKKTTINYLDKLCRSFVKTGRA